MFDCKVRPYLMNIPEMEDDNKLDARHAIEEAMSTLSNHPRATFFGNANVCPHS